MNPSQKFNLIKMSTVSPDTSRETATPLTDGCNNNRMVAVVVLQDVVITSQVRVLRGVYSDTTQLNSTEHNWPSWTAYTAKQSCFCLWRNDLQTESTGSLRSLIGDSCSRCERVDNSTSSSSSVELCRYKRAFSYTGFIVNATALLCPEWTEKILCLCFFVDNH